jgi:hypothetical protein
MSGTFKKWPRRSLRATARRATCSSQWSGHGRVAGRGNLARQWSGTRPVESLILAVRHSGGRYAVDTERELRAAG